MWSFGTTMTMAKDNDPSLASTSKAQQSQQSQQSQLPQPPQTSPQLPEALQSTTASPRPRPPILSQRSLKQLGLFFAGAGFLALSTAITRRAVVRKRLATIPKFYYPSNQQVNKMDSDSSLIALEALNLATLNVMGFGIMMTGGLSWAFDISSVDDLRAKSRAHLGPSGGQTDEEAEREIEEWAAKVLGWKESKGKDNKSPPEKAD
ncbi:uncharacterized protein F4812DRAFT_238303 [Daldinia caldariorum]|uniref:uncharacterized protein n=1 Tax=Daldinia caldariorum TaxID=326644 RepID=UPI002008004E|nr:uncharacterized protein F4812DRAFT_238303 [Daldinia caldariorum]KAI1463698.1 hypothetical protein F4812DRAFT_238303 [Daldinia caldariorum]